MFIHRVSESNDGQRIDLFLSKSFGISKILLHKLIRKRKIFINDTLLDSLSLRLQKGYKIRINADISITSKSNKVQHIPESLSNIIKNRIVFEDNNIIVINKPYNMPSQGGEKIQYSLDKIVYSIYPESKITHRLDAETRGLIVFAKNIETCRKITQLFEQKKVVKKYIAFCHNVPNWNKYSCDMYILDKNKNRKLSAKTDFEVLEMNKEKNMCKIACYPKTGRKHQIRIHLSKLGFPIIGEKKYHNDKENDLQLFSVSINIPDVCNISIETEKMLFD